MVLHTYRMNIYRKGFISHSLQQVKYTEEKTTTFHIIVNQYHYLALTKLHFK